MCWGTHLQVAILQWITSHHHQYWYEVSRRVLCYDSLSSLSVQRIRWSLYTKQTPQFIEVYPLSLYAPLKTFGLGYAPGWSVLIVISIIVLSTSTVLNGSCIVYECNNPNWSAINSCNPQTNLQRGTMRGAAVYSLLWFSESWSLSSAVWALRLEQTIDWCTGCAVALRGKGERLNAALKLESAGQP